MSNAIKWSLSLLYSKQASQRMQTVQANINLCLQVICNYQLADIHGTHAWSALPVKNSCTEFHENLMICSLTLRHTNRWVDMISTSSIFRHVCQTVKSAYQLCHFRLSVNLHGKIRLPLDGFSWNLISDYFLKIYYVYLSLIKIWQE